MALALVHCGQVIGLRDDYYALEADSAGAGDMSLGGTAAAAAGGSVAGANGGLLNGGAGDVHAADAGEGGAPDRESCTEHPFTPVSSWVPTASSENKMEASAALTDSSAKRWSSGKPQSGDEWVQIDFGAPVSLRRINLQQGTANSNDYPRQFSVRVSDTQDDLSGAACLTGVGSSGVTTTIVLPKVYTGRYLLIRQLGASLSWWSAEEIELSCFDG